MMALRGDLASPEEPEDPRLRHRVLFDFDVAICVLAFHHFADPAQAAKRLADRLRPGGVLCVVDFLEEGLPVPIDPELRRMQNYTVEHHGFSKEQIWTMFNGAGAGVDFAIQEMGSGYTRCGALGTKQERVLFLARGTKTEVS